VTVLVGGALLALASPPAAVGAPASRVVEVTADPPIVGYGARVVLYGSVTGGDGTAASRVAVAVSGKVAGEPSFTVLGTVWTDVSGRFALTVTPLRSTTYRVEIPGQSAGPTGSAETFVSVRPRVLIRLSAKMWAGGPAAFRGQVLPQQAPGTVVLIQRRVSGSWRTVAEALTDEASRFSVVWTPSEEGRALFRAAVPPQEGRPAAVSRTLVRYVRDPNPHHVPSVVERLIVIDHAAFRLYYYERGCVVRDFPCVLGKPSTPTPLGKGFRIRRKRMNPGGANGSRYLGYLGRIGIHGTDQPGLLRRFPRAFSHGCARLFNRDAIWLYDRAPIGTRVWNVRGTPTHRRATL